MQNCLLIILCLGQLSSTKLNAYISIRGGTQKIVDRGGYAIIWGLKFDRLLFFGLLKMRVIFFGGVEKIYIIF